MIDEEIQAVELLNNIEERSVLTSLEVKLSNRIIELKKQLKTLIEKDKNE